jgi:uncharacterized protein (TIGR02246 family)
LAAALADLLAQLQHALAERYTIERELGAGGMTTVLPRPRWGWVTDERIHGISRRNAMRSYRTAGLISLLSAVTACAPKQPPPPDAAAIRTAIVAQAQKGLDQILHKDTVALAAFFTEDATWILPDASTFKGRAAIQKGGVALLASFETATAGPIALDRLIVVNDTEAVTFMTQSGTMTMKGKKPQTYTNPFADYWKKGADGVWRVAYEINAEAMAPEAAAPAKRR